MMEVKFEVKCMQFLYVFSKCWWLYFDKPRTKKKKNKALSSFFLHKVRLWYQSFQNGNFKFSELVLGSFSSVWWIFCVSCSCKVWQNIFPLSKMWVRPCVFVPWNYLIQTKYFVFCYIKAWLKLGYSVWIPPPPCGRFKKHLPQGECEFHTQPDSHYIRYPAASVLRSTTLSTPEDTGWHVHGKWGTMHSPLLPGTTVNCKYPSVALDVPSRQTVTRYLRLSLTLGYFSGLWLPYTYSRPL